MNQRKQPITSILAHNSIKESKSAMYAKIVEGLEKLRVGGTFDEIAISSGLKPQQVWKRNSELAKMKVIFDTGITRPGLSGRSCTVWQLYSIIYNQKPTGVPIQTDLFS